MPPQARIGDYNVIKTVGSGSFGKVKKAIHVYSDMVVALKIISRSKLSHSDMIGRVNREIKYLKMLRHPHIIKLYEVISNKVDIIMVMEYAGGELFNYLVEKGRMPENEAKRFFQQIISAVEFCHKKGIVHRDLKPENLLLDAFNNIKIADFGLSNVVKDGEFLNTSCGSPNYAAPEVINGKLYAGPDVDVWSCGIILYVMLCGKLPFDDENIPNLFKKISSGIFSIPSHVSSGARNLIQQMLIVDPLKRITIAKIRQDHWFNLDLPEYLKPSPDGTDPMRLDIINNETVDIVSAKLGMQRSEVISHLKTSGYNYVKVSYQLINDNRYMLEVSKHFEDNANKSFGQSISPPAWNAMSVNAFSPGSLNPSSMLSNSNRNDHFYGNDFNPIKKGINDIQKDEEIFEPSSVSILGSSIPKPRSMANSGLKLSDSSRFPIIPGKIPVAKQSNITRAVLENNAIRSTSQKNGDSSQSNLNTSSIPTRIPSNYFRASLPPVSGTLSNSSLASNKSSAENTTALGKTSSNDFNMITSNNTDNKASNSNDSSPKGFPKTPGFTRYGNPTIPLDTKKFQYSSSVDQSSQPGSISSSYNQGYFNTKPLERKQTRARPRWHFGIRSRSQPSEVMSEIYKTLVTLKMEWKQINPYKIRIRYYSPVTSEEKESGVFTTGLPISENLRDNVSPRRSSVSNSPFSKIGGLNRTIVTKKIIETKVDLQLYKLDSRNYLVDFKVVIPSQKSQTNADSSNKNPVSLPINPEPVDVASVSRSLTHSLSKGDNGSFNFNSSLSPLNQSNFGSLRVSDQMHIDNINFNNTESQGSVFEGGMELELENTSNNNHDFGSRPSAHPVPDSDNIFGQSIDIGNSFLKNNDLHNNKSLPEPGSLPEFDQIPPNSFVQSLPKVENPEFSQGSLFNDAIPMYKTNESARHIRLPNPMEIPSSPQGLPFEAHSHFTSQMAHTVFEGGSLINRNFTNRSSMLGVSSDQRRGSISVNKTSANTSGQVFNIFPFFEVCTKLITELTLPSQKPQN
ncbi:Carbon catabolite-derepressing protein kinase [Smittium mucronatum]|uniref:non-specific serine/threonine protein kinase n=1 Tax=Smittium mucronatum TaxID=133383 RepID=A0A1R0H9B2_9FUNG|nr:Carbon catabolite-derepressing protein kinase [Smittium mucronatum]